MRVSYRLLAALGLGTCLSVPLASQSPDQQSSQLPTFKAEVEYVEVDALVTDERGAVVRDLRKEDFQIFEDGKSQSIAGFAFVEIPVETSDRSSSAHPEPDVRSNERPFAGRVYVLILDDLHTAPLRAPRVKRAAQQFIDRHLAANDLMAVVHIGGPSDGSQEFTSNKRLLSAAVDRFMGQKIESATMARNELFFNGASVATGAVADPFDAERGFNALATTRVLTEVAEKTERDTRPPEDDSVHQRGPRLRHHRRDEQSRGVVDSGRHSRCDCGGDTLECQHLRRRSARADGNGRRSHRGRHFRGSAAPYGSGRSRRASRQRQGTARHRHELAAHGAADVAGQPQDPCRRDQRVCCRQLQRLQLRPSSGLSARTARTTCLPTIRRRTDGTAGFIGSKSGRPGQVSPSVHGEAMSCRKRTPKTQRSREQRYLASPC